MKRKYSTGTFEDKVFFIGKEVEHTPAYGMKTLFVVGIQPINEIDLNLSYGKESTNHIFFGANHSFNPKDNLEWQRWEGMIQHFLEEGYLCSLDIPLSVVEEFNDCDLNTYSNFIPQIRVPVPYIQLWNYNTMIKIDDKGFNATNPGVWSHSLHSLTDRKNFTPWSAYNNDKIIK